MAIEVLPVTTADIPAAVACIQTAFADDPFFKWIFDTSKYNIDRNAASLTAHFQYGINCNAPIYVAKYTPDADQKIPFFRDPRPQIVGVCWWYPPQPTSQPGQTWTTWTQDWLLSFRQLLFNIRYLGRGGLNLRRYYRWKEAQKDTHGAIWTDPRGYYFCNVIAVDSRMRGMGVGRMLVDVVTEKADREGVPCYLESSKGFPNLRIYEKLGFGLVREIECLDGADDCRLYCMTREPKVKA